MINTRATIVAWLRGTFVDINLTVGASKTSRAEALGPVMDSSAKSAMLAHAFRAEDIHTAVLGGSSGSKSLLCRMAFKAGPLA